MRATVRVWVRALAAALVRKRVTRARGSMAVIAGTANGWPTGLPKEYQGKKE
jgi:hypothetical protein